MVFAERDNGRNLFVASDPALEIDVEARFGTAHVAHPHFARDFQGGSRSATMSKGNVILVFLWLWIWPCVAQRSIPLGALAAVLRVRHGL